MDTNRLKARAATTPSNLLQRSLCPGSARMEAGLKDRDDDDARRGRLLHSYWAHKEFERRVLSHDQQDLLALSDDLLEQVLNILGFELEHDTFVEQKMWTRDGRLSGTPDRVYLWRERKAALIADLKSGFKTQERAELNLQLRGYALIAADNFDLDDAYVALLQPRARFDERATLARYEETDIERSRAQIHEIIDATVPDDAPLRASEQACRFCKAKLICPAFREAVSKAIIPFTLDGELSVAAREEQIAKIVANCTDEQLERVLEACALADHVEEIAKDETRRRIEAGAMTNFTLGKAWKARAIRDPRRAIALLSLARIATRDEILDICDIPLKQLEENYRARTKLTWKKAREKIDQALKSVLDFEDRKGRILRK